MLKSPIALSLDTLVIIPIAQLRKWKVEKLGNLILTKNQGDLATESVFNLNAT